jgi:hypothetical protein
LDPVIIENAFSALEGVIAPTLKSLYKHPRVPNVEELKKLLYFAAFQYVRVPAFRPAVLKIADSIHRSWMAGALKTPVSWEKALKRAGISAENPGAAYQDMLNFEREVIKTGQYSLSAENEWYLLRGFKVVEGAILPSFSARFWATLVSESGNFIGSDNPVVMDGRRGEMMGFKSAEVVIFPVNRHILLYGTNAPVAVGGVNRKLIARHNTFTMLTADEQLYSHVPDFCWLDETCKYQTDWKLFSKEKLLGSIA